MVAGLGFCFWLSKWHLLILNGYYLESRSSNLTSFLYLRVFIVWAYLFQILEQVRTSWRTCSQSSSNFAKTCLNLKNYSNLTKSYLVRFHRLSSEHTKITPNIWNYSISPFWNLKIILKRNSFDRKTLCIPKREATRKLLVMYHFY